MIKVLFICHGNIRKLLEKPDKYCVSDDLGPVFIPRLYL